MCMENSKKDLTKLLIEFKDVFAQQCIDAKGEDPQFCMHRINSQKDVVPVISQRYRMNLNYGRHVKDEWDKLLKVGLIIHQIKSHGCHSQSLFLRRMGSLEFVLIIESSIQPQKPTHFLFHFITLCWMQWLDIKCKISQITLVAIIRFQWHQRIGTRQYL